jgi:hypothetical protein
MGMAMGAAIVAIVRSPWGKQSGAHFNPAITFTFYHLGKVASWDAVFCPGNFSARLPASRWHGVPAHKAVRDAATLPGVYGDFPAFLAEVSISFFRTRSPTCRVSQGPRLLFPCALFPTTPEGPTGCLLVASPPVTGFILLGRLATFNNITRPNPVASATARRFASPVSTRWITPSRLRFRYTYERAIYMGNSFQFTRSARLCLVFLTRPEQAIRANDRK